MLFRKLLLRRRLDRELRDEFEFHLQARADELVGRGLSREAARRQAAIEFGGVEKHKETVRDLRRVRVLEDFVRDLAYAVRNLRRQPLFALSAAIAVALGVGLNAAVFSSLYALLLRPLPVRDPGSLRNVWFSFTGEQRRSSYGSSHFVSFDEFNYVRSHARTAEVAGVAEGRLATPISPAGLHVQLVSDNLLPMLGGRPIAGRFFTPEEASHPGSEPVMVLSYAAWQRLFGGEPIVGRVVVANRTPFTIVGVADEHTAGPLLLKADAWIPLTMQPVTRAGEAFINDPTTAWIQVLARVKRGVANSAVRAEMDVLQQQALSRASPGMRVKATVARAALFNSPEFLQDGMPIFGVLFFAVSLLLLAACANVANMVLARGLSRTREFAIRLSLGAGKGRIIRQFMTENLVVAALGGAIGLALAQLVLRLAVSMIPPEDAGIQADMAPDLSIVLWTLAVSLIAGIVFGLPPALGLLRRDLSVAARAGSSSAPRRRWSMQGVLIAAQVAVSAVLLVNAALLVRALGTAVHMDLGQATRNVLVVLPNVRDMQYKHAEAERYFDELRERVAGLPGVRAVSLTAFDPYVASCGTSVTPVGSNGTESKNVPAGCHDVGPEFFATMRKPILQGRTFSSAECHDGARVVIVDADFANRYLDGSALGKRVRVGTDIYDIVGVVTGSKSLRRSRGAEIYFPFLSGPRYLEGKLLVSYDGRPDPLAAGIRLESAKLDRDLPITIKPIEQNVASALGPVRAAAIGAGSLGAIALVLSGAGVYGVIAFAVGRRRREIGIRMALGAERAAVLRLVAGQGSRPVLIGAAFGIAMSVACARLIQAMLYGVSPLDPISIAAALLVLMGVAAIASFSPARAALRVDPATTLRDE